MTDLAVAGVDMVPGYSRDAAKILVTLIRLNIGSSQSMRVRPYLVERRDEWCRHGVAHRKKAATPIWIPTEIVIDMRFDLSRHGLIRIAAAWSPRLGPDVRYGTPRHRKDELPGELAVDRSPVLIGPIVASENNGGRLGNHADPTAARLAGRCALLVGQRSRPRMRPTSCPNVFVSTGNVISGRCEKDLKERPLMRLRQRHQKPRHIAGY